MVERAVSLRVRQASSGCRQCGPWYRAKERSAEHHVAKCSTATAARYASGVSLPRASILRDRSWKIDRWRSPGSTGTAAGEWAVEYAAGGLRLRAGIGREDRAELLGTGMHEELELDVVG